MSKIEGYCIQNGEPTLDNPAEIESLELDMTDIVNLKDISERFNNGTETIEDIINYCRNYEIKFGYDATIRVVEKKYFDKLVKKIKELETKLEFKKWGDLDNIQFEEYMNQFIQKQKVKDVLQKNRNELFSITYVEPIQYKPFEMQVERINKIEKELLEDK